MAVERIAGEEDQIGGEPAGGRDDAGEPGGRVPLARTRRILVVNMHVRTVHDDNIPCRAGTPQQGEGTFVQADSS